MISYAIKSNVRKNVIIGITIISIILTPMLNEVLKEFLKPFNIEFLSEYRNFYTTIYATICSLSFSTIFGVLYFIYSKYIWKTTIIQKWHNIPNLNGVWTGKSISMKDGIDKAGRNVIVNIKQDWNKINITTHISDSKSVCSCIVAGIDEEEMIIKYSYQNLNLGEKEKYMGYNELKLDTLKSEIMGGYFTNKPSKGKFEIKKEYNEQN